MDALQAMAERQGVLRFRTDPVPAEQIEAVLTAAAAAPSPVNLQPWAFVVVTDRAVITSAVRYLVDIQESLIFKELLQMPGGYTERLMILYEGFERAPCFVFLCLQAKANFARPQHEAVLRDWYMLSLGAAMQNLMVAATALGLGTRWYSGFALDQPAGGPLKEMLGIPPEVEVVAATPLGYRDEPSKARPVQEWQTVAGFRRGDSRALGELLRGRLRLEDLVHREKW